MKKIIITGASGFIGYHLTKYLSNNLKNIKVYAVDDLSSSEQKIFPQKVKFLKIDCSKKKILEIFKKTKIDAIFHIAGQASGENSFYETKKDMKNNLETTLNLSKLCEITNCKKFYFASSMAIYGDLPKSPIGEDSQCDPKSYYSIHKKASEEYLKILSKKRINVTILRLFNVYGPGQNLLNNNQGMLKIYLKQLLKSNKIFVKGKLSRYRDFIYIDDVINAFFQAYKKNRNGYRVYNVGTGNKTTVKELILLISAHLNKKPNIVKLNSTPGDQLGTYADINKIKKELNWKPKFQLNYGLKKFIDYLN